MPYVRPGQVVGLLGGSFDPAHEGHAHITREALKRFGLDWVWWLVSPGNPLKARGPAGMAMRMARARAVMDHPRVRITDIEARLGTRYTAETLGRLMVLYPGVRFVWLMGADNLAEFDQWRDWRGIMGSVPVGVLARSGQRMAARDGKAVDVFRTARLRAAQARVLARGAPPRWCFVNVPMRSISSTELRRAGKWQPGKSTKC